MVGGLDELMADSCNCGFNLVKGNLTISGDGGMIVALKRKVGVLLLLIMSRIVDEVVVVVVRKGMRR